MRLSLLSGFLTIFFISGCAYKGVVVEKQASPQPFYHTLGTDGSYAFLLRDEGGAVHRQLVTPEVFERYAVGDYFNDLLPAPSRPFEGKSMAAIPAPVSKAAPRVASTQTKSHRVATTRKHKAHKANKAHNARKTARRRTKHRAITRKAAPVQPAPRITTAAKVHLPPQQSAAIDDAHRLLASVVRCR